MARTARGGGFLATLQRLLATLLLIARARLELVSVEVEEQIAYAANLLVWTLIAVFCASLVVVFVAVTVLIACWEHYRLAAAIGITLVLALITMAALLVVRARLRSRPRFLVATISELGQDATAVIVPDEPRP